MNFRETARYGSDILNCTYIVGHTEDGRYVYIWTTYDLEDNEIPADALADPTAMHGAMVGTKEEIVEEIETCVGSFRYTHEGEPEGEEAEEVVATLLAGVES